MSYALSSNQVQSLNTILSAPITDGNRVDFYQSILNLVSVPDANGTDGGVEGAQLRLWLQGAIQENGGEGVFSALIHGYTSTQAALNGVGSVGNLDLQDASNAVADEFFATLEAALAFHNQTGQPLVMPSLDVIASDDASAIGSTLFANLTTSSALSANAAWSGTLMFSMLGNYQLYRLYDAAGPDTGGVLTVGSFKNVVYAVESFTSAFSNLGQLFADNYGSQSFADLLSIGTTVATGGDIFAALANVPEGSAKKLAAFAGDFSILVKTLQLWTNQSEQSLGAKLLTILTAAVTSVPDAMLNLIFQGTPAESAFNLVQSVGTAGALNALREAFGLEAISGSTLQVAQATFPTSNEQVPFGTSIHFVSDMTTAQVLKLASQDALFEKILENLSPLGLSGSDTLRVVTKPQAYMEDRAGMVVALYGHPADSESFIYVDDATGKSAATPTAHQYSGIGPEPVYIRFGAGTGAVIKGEGTTNHLYGGAGDTLQGGAGQDMLVSGGHGSHLIGGSGETTMYAVLGDVIDFGAGQQGALYIFARNQDGSANFSTVVSAEGGTWNRTKEAFVDDINHLTYTYDGAGNLIVNFEGTSGSIVVHNFDKSLSSEAGVVLKDGPASFSDSYFAAFAVLGRIDANISNMQLNTLISKVGADTVLLKLCELTGQSTTDTPAEIKTSLQTKFLEYGESLHLNDLSVYSRVDLHELVQSNKSIAWAVNTLSNFALTGDSTTESKLYTGAADVRGIIGGTRAVSDKADMLYALLHPNDADVTSYIDMAHGVSVVAEFQNSSVVFGSAQTGTIVQASAQQGNRLYAGADGQTLKGTAGVNEYYVTKGSTVIDTPGSETIHLQEGLTATSLTYSSIVEGSDLRIHVSSNAADDIVIYDWYTPGSHQNGTQTIKDSNGNILLVANLDPYGSYGTTYLANGTTDWVEYGTSVSATTTYNNGDVLKEYRNDTGYGDSLINVDGSTFAHTYNINHILTLSESREKDGSTHTEAYDDTGKQVSSVAQGADGSHSAWAYDVDGTFNENHTDAVGNAETLVKRTDGSSLQKYLNIDGSITTITITSSGNRSNVFLDGKGNGHSENYDAQDNQTMSLVTQGKNVNGWSIDSIGTKFTWTDDGVGNSATTTTNVEGRLLNVSKVAADHSTYTMNYDTSLHTTTYEMFSGQLLHLITGASEDFIQGENVILGSDHDYANIGHLNTGGQIQLTGGFLDDHILAHFVGNSLVLESSAGAVVTWDMDGTASSAQVLATPNGHLWSADDIHQLQAQIVGSWSGTPVTIY